MKTTLQKYNIFTLPNGLRAVHLHSDSPVAYLGAVIGAGSREDEPDAPGLAHFVEHTIFKGTSHRSSRLINLRMESVGGELNAYTTKEDTVLFTNAPAGYTSRALELIYDLIANSSFPSGEVERERDVVVEEIYSYLDSPAEAVYDEFDERIFAGSALGHTILGTPESVRRMAGSDCREFVDKHYRPENIVVYCVDSTPADRFEKLVERFFGKLSYPGKGTERTFPRETDAFDLTDDRGGHQAHTVTGLRLFGRQDDRRHALFLLNNYLGGPGMSSALNQQMREKRGYVYTVESNVALMNDCGVWSVYFGSDRKVVGRCHKLIDRELGRLASDTVSSRRLDAMKRQYIGQLLVSGDGRESMAMSLGKSLSYYGEVHDINWTADRVRAITAEELRSVAEMLASGRRSTLTLC